MATPLWLKRLRSNLTRHQTVRSRRKKPTQARPQIDVLEDRTLPSAYIVTTTADSGPGSFRDAINQINADTTHTLYPSPSNPGVDEIDFNITAASDTGGGFNAATGVATIMPQQGLPTISNAVFIDGYTQAGASPNTLTVGDNAVLKVELDGANAGPGNGIVLGADDISVLGLVINRFSGNFPASGDGAGVSVGGSNDVVEGNYIGTDVSGEYALGNSNGVWLDGGASNNTISGNVIAANSGRVGVGLEDFNSPSVPITGNVVQGNLIGTDATGMHTIDPNGHSLGNALGLEVNYANGNDIEGNVIDGNNGSSADFGAGISVYASSNNVIRGNAISQNNGNGVSLAAGSSPCSGNLIQGNVISQNSGNGVLASAPSNTVGGTASGAGNVITGNGGDGVFVGNGATGVSILGNSISASGGLGIFLDSTTNANDNQAAPVLFAATSQAGNTYIGGALASVPNTTFRVEFFSNASADPSGHGQGQTYLGFVNVTTDATGTVDFIATFAGVGASVPYISTTATRLNAGTPVETSGFSNDVNALASPSAYVVTTTADSGPGSLRDAINQIDLDTSHALYASPSNPSVDEIDFNITAASDTGGGFNATTGVATISPQSAFGSAPNSNITQSVIIDGYTEPGASPNTLTQGDNEVLKIQLQLSALAGGIGLNLSANNNTIRGLVLDDLPTSGFAAITLGPGSLGDVIEGNFIGTSVSGSTVIGGGGGTVGISLYGGNTGVIIGGTTPDARNVIAGFGTGIDGFSGSCAGDVVQGNYIGTDATGTIALGNGEGVDAQSATIDDNLISGNQTGINVYSGGPAQIQGNLIGTDVTGTRALGNGTGILLGTSSTIGGTTAAARNIISGNTGVGIFAAYAPNAQIEGNYIGTDIMGTKAVAGEGDGIWLWTSDETVGGSAQGDGNVISGNSIGIRGFGSNEVIQGNLIGTDYTGTKAIGNGSAGILFQDGGNNNLIGGLDTNAASQPLAGGGNLISGNAGGGNGGIIFTGANGESGQVIEGNYIGTDITGETTTGSDGKSLGNVFGITLGGTNNTVGGTSPAARNIISGNYFGGVTLGSGNSSVEGNYIGTDATGAFGLGNGDGVWLNGATDNTISGNLISANHKQSGVEGLTGYGIFFAGGNSGNVVQGNLIGTNATGTNTVGTDGKPLGNATGVLVDSNELIGGITPGSGNAIAGNIGDGVFVGGSAEHNAPGSGNSILGNSIHDNGGLGIDLEIGANDNQTAPVLTLATCSAVSTTISGTLTSVATTTFRIEFFASASGVSGADAQTYLGYANVSTNAGGQASFSVSGLPNLPAGEHFVTATATNLSTNDTSQISGAILPTPTVTVTGGLFTYNGSAEAATATATGVAGAVVSGSFTFTYNGSSTVATNAGAYTVVATFTSSDPGYTNAVGTGTITINPALLTISATSASKTYDGTTRSAVNPSYQVSGEPPNTLYNSDTLTGLTQAFTSKDVLGAGNSTLVVTGYTISDGNGGKNYTVTLHTATGTITPALLSISAVSDSKVYNGTTSSMQTPAFQVSGEPANMLYDSDTVTGLTQAFVSKNVLGTGGSTLQVTGYTINDGNGGKDYTVTLHTATGTITPAPLTVTANNASKIYGAPNPGFSVSYAGFVNGETPSNLGGTLTFSTPATQSIPVGTYPITPSGLTSSNYAITFVPGTLTITITPGSIYLLDPTAGGALTLSGNASINTPGTVVVDSSSTSAILASGNATVTASGVLVVGSVSKSGNAKVTKTGTPGATGDPLAGLVVPTAPSYTGPMSESLSGNSTATISQGSYSQISISGNAQLKLNAGVYVIGSGGVTLSGNASLSASGVTLLLEGGSFTVSGNVSVTGTNVLIVNAGSTYPNSGSFGAVTMSGNGTVSLTPFSTGADAGILILQPKANTKPLTFSGNAMQGISGTIYAPGAALDESGNAQVGSASNPIALIVDTLSLSGNAIANMALSAEGAAAYTPLQIRTAYGVNSLPLDGTGQTIALVEAYDDPMLYQALDTFDTQFGLTASGPNLYSQYGPAASFLAVLNQDGQATSLPATDPTGGWETEEALDVEWAHALAPGAQIIVVESNSQSLADLMAGVATAANQPGVSVVSMSWGFPEGQAVLQEDEALYDGVFTTPAGHAPVTFVASTGDYGSADPEYPAFSPNVVAVGGTSLTLNADNSYSSETGWGYYSSDMGAFIGSGGGSSLYEPEPTYQAGVQSTGNRTTPDVSFVADPATGAWIADPYNLPADNPWEIAGGTSLSAPCWAGLFAVVDQGRSLAGETPLSSSAGAEVHQALYSLPPSDFNTISSGSNGAYMAAPGYNLVTGLGTPVANSLVPALVAYQGNAPANQTAADLPSSGAAASGSASGSATPINVFNVFDVATVGIQRVDFAFAPGHVTTPGSLQNATMPTVGLVTAINATGRGSGAVVHVAGTVLASPSSSGPDGPLASLSLQVANTLVANFLGTPAASVTQHAADSLFRMLGQTNPSEAILGIPVHDAFSQGLASERMLSPLTSDGLDNLDWNEIGSALDWQAIDGSVEPRSGQGQRNAASGAAPPSAVSQAVVDRAVLDQVFALAADATDQLGEDE